jgi:DNA-directed RNA polymerase specialized sigma24 family protein
MTSNSYGQAYQAGFERTVRFLISRGARGDRAQEAAQAAWVRGWERLNQLRNDDLVLTWVNAIALNCYRASLRREVLTQALPELTGSSAIDLSAIDAARVLRFCRPRHRLLLLQQAEGFSTAELARDHGVTPTAIRIRLMRARRAARALLETGTVELQRRVAGNQPVRDAA